MDVIKLLDCYTEDDREVFFGRQDEVTEITQRLQEYRIMIVSGESGAGKTSVLRAGLIPQISGYHTVYHRLNAESKNSLAEQLQFYTDNKKSVDNPGDIFPELQHYLHDNNTRLLLILDQFEELLIQQQIGQEWFSPEFVLQMHADEQCTILFCLRSDYLPLFMEWLHSSSIYFYADQFFYLKRFTTLKAINIIRNMMDKLNIAIDYQNIATLADKLAALDALTSVYPPHIQIIAAYLTEHQQLDALVVDDDNIKLETILSNYFDNELFKNIQGSERQLVKNIFDILVGREGLRRKLTVIELSEKLHEPVTVIEPLLSLLIKRRALRRTREDRYELIHDFLSKHFFETFSNAEKKKRRFQDMFYTAMLDFRDSNIYLDERRLKLFLHHRDLLNMDEEARMFILRSILALSNMSLNYYIDTSMIGDLLRLYDECTLIEDRQGIINLLGNLVGTAEYDSLKQICENEKDPATKSNILTMLAEIDPFRTKDMVLEYLAEWELLHDNFQEGVIRAIQSIPHERCISFILKLVQQANISESLLQTCLRTLGGFYDQEIIEQLLIILENNEAPLTRKQESIVDEINYFLSAGITNEKVMIIKTRYISYLKKLIAKQGGEISSYVYGAYVHHSLPAPGELNSLLKSTDDILKIDAIINAISSIVIPGYLPILFDQYENNSDESLQVCIIRVIQAYKFNQVETKLLHWYRKSSSNYVKSTIIYALIDKKSSHVLPISREIIHNNKYFNTELYTAALSGVSNLGDEQDLKFLEEQIFSTNDHYVQKEHIYAIANFKPKYKDDVTMTLARLWDKKLSPDLHSMLAMELIKKENYKCLEYIIEKLATIDEHFEGINRPQLIPMLFNQYTDIFKTLLMIKKPLLEQERFKPHILDIIAHSGNRQVAVHALIFYIHFYGETDESREYFLALLKTANRPEMQGVAAMALAVYHPDYSFDTIITFIKESGPAITRNFATYALGMMELTIRNHERRMDFLLSFIKNTDINNHVSHVLRAYKACADNEDAVKLELILNTREYMQTWGDIGRTRIENTIGEIRSKPLKDRKFPSIEVFYDPFSYFIPQSLYF